MGETVARRAPLTWAGTVRLGLVQTAIGSMAVLMTSTLNRVMVVEVGLLALVPGVLVGLHFFVQVSRAHAGFGSDRHARRVPWVLAGVAILAASMLAAAAAVGVMLRDARLGLLLAIPAFVGIGAGMAVGATPFLALLAERVAPARRAGAAALTWIMMIFGMALTAGVAGALLDPFSPARLLAVVGGVCALALAVTALAVWGNESRGIPSAAAASEDDAPARRVPFREALREVWAEDGSRRMAIFIFVSMLAYSAQDLILEPFAGEVFGMTPGESTRIGGMQHGGALLGMLLAAFLAQRYGTLQRWAAAGCAASAAAFAALAATAFVGGAPLLQAVVVVLGIANGAYAVGAIGAMMGMMGAGRPERAGLRMGVWGAAQAVAYGAGNLLGTGASDLAQRLLGAPAPGYALVFVAEGVLFLGAALAVARLAGGGARAAEVDFRRDGAAVLATVR